MIKFDVIGSDLQLLEIHLAPDESIIAEAGALTCMDQGIAYETTLSDGSDRTSGLFGKVMAAGSRLLTGESLFLTEFKNTFDKVQSVSFSSPLPGKIIAIPLSEHNGEIICQKGGFIAATLGTTIRMKFSKKLSAGFFGGEGFILQSIIGNGHTFINVGGTVVEKNLNEETLIVETGALVAFSQGIDYDIRAVKNIKSMLFGGEGLFLTTLSGTGKVWVQSLPYNRFVANIAAHIPDKYFNKKK